MQSPLQQAWPIVQPAPFLAHAVAGALQVPVAASQTLLQHSEELWHGFASSLHGSVQTAAAPHEPLQQSADEQHGMPSSAQSAP
jgi:hypothetical protein